MFRRTICTVCPLLVLIVAHTTSAGLVGHWKLDEGSGTIVADSSGNGNDGTIVNNPTWIPGRAGTALEFHGLGAAGGGGDYINCGNDPSLDVTGPISIALWIRPGADDPEGQGTETAPLCKAQSGLSPSWSWQVRYGWGGAPQPNMAFTFNTSPRAWAFVGGKLQRDEWVHIACTHDGATLKCFVNGVETDSTPMGTITSSSTPVLIGSDGWGSDWIGAIDDVRIYDHALTEPELLGAMEGNISPQAWGPAPKDGEMYTQTWANLSWRPGPFAVSHDVYIGENFDDVNNGSAGVFQGNYGSPSLVVGFFGFPLPDGLIPGTTYYWRIDEVNDADPNSPWKGSVWSFWIPPISAYGPNPIDGAMFEQTSATLNWTPGFGTKLNHVYFGRDPAQVEAGAPSVYKGPFPAATYNPGPLEKDTVYYWRIDEFDGAKTNAGDVWSFRTVPVIPVSDPSLVGWWRFDEGAGATAVDYSGGDHHGTITGDPQWVDGYAGGALEFDGSEDLVEALGYPGVTGTNPRTVSAWIRTEELGEIASWGINSTGQKWIFRVQASNGTNGAIRVEVNGGYQVGSTDLRDGQWHHVAATLADDGTPDVTEIALYVDGEQELISANQSTAINTATTGYVRIGEAPWHNRPFTGLIDDVRIYNKALTQDEIKLVMRVDPLLAWNRTPADRSTPNVDSALPLAWSRGDRAAQHDVYFGTDRDAVAGADASDTSGVYRGRQSAVTYTPPEGVEWGGGPYYWRVDESNNDGTITAGGVWSFTVADYILVDDFESYNDIDPPQSGSNTIFGSWADGYGIATNGALTAEELPPYAEQTVVRTGRQSMKYVYDANLKICESTLTLTQHNWTDHGVTRLSLWFRGSSTNAVERMFVALNGTAVVYHDDPAAAQTGSWTEWPIDLARFANQGVDLTNVNTFTIGFGTKNAPAVGGAGEVYFDDIRLYR